MRFPAVNWIAAILIGGCANHAHTPESTSGMTNEELAALCADLEIRATMDCRWNMQEQTEFGTQPANLGDQLSGTQGLSTREFR